MSKKLGQEVTRWTLKKQFYLVEGVENLPLEATTPNSHNSQYNVPDLFAKLVKLTDRIKIIPADNQGKPEENKPDNNKNIPIPNQIKEYFRKNKIKRVFLDKKDLKVEYEKTGISTFIQAEKWDISKNFSELSQMIDYFKKTGKTLLTQEELNIKNANTNSNSTKKPQKILVRFSISGIILVIVGIITWLLVAKKRKNSIK